MADREVPIDHDVGTSPQRGDECVLDRQDVAHDRGIDVPVALAPTFERVLVRRVEKDADVRFMYSPQIIQSKRKITLNFKNEPLANVLETVLKPLLINYLLIEK